MDSTDGCDCICMEGYTGLSCATPPPCDADNHCSGHGSTSDMDHTDGCVCVCSEGYTGTNCATPPKCQAAQDCNAHGTTDDMDSTDGCDCTCTEGYTGLACASPPVCDTTKNIALKTNGAKCTMNAPDALWPNPKGADCSQVIDGKRKWTHASGRHMVSETGDPWLMLEFPKKMIVDVIKLYQHTGANMEHVLGKIKYQTRDNDGVTWTTRFTKTTVPKNGMEPFHLAPNVVTDAVRIVGLENTKKKLTGGDHGFEALYRFEEVMVEGCSATP